MNGYQRIHAALRGEAVDSIPVMLHNFMLAAQESGYSMAQFRSDPSIIAESYIRSVETYQFDGILVDIDTATLAGAVGVPIEFTDNVPATNHLGCLDSLHDIHQLKTPDVGSYQYVQVWLEAVSKLKSYFKDEIFIRGNCDQAPFSLASMMRTPQNWFIDLALEPQIATDLLEYCTQASCQFIELMAETGADMISNGDSPAGPDLVSPQMYEQFALPYEQRVVDASHRANLPYTLHICGKTDSILDLMISTQADAFELDYKTDARAARNSFQGKATFIGNIDPVGVLQQGNPKDVRRATQELIETFQGNPRFILNAGCAIPQDTPADNIFEMIRTARRI